MTRVSAPVRVSPFRYFVTDVSRKTSTLRGASKESYRRRKMRAVTTGSKGQSRCRVAFDDKVWETEQPNRWPELRGLAFSLRQCPSVAHWRFEKLGSSAFQRAKILLYRVKFTPFSGIVPNALPKVVSWGETIAGYLLRPSVYPL